MNASSEKPVLNQEYEYFGQKAKVVKIHPYPSTAINGEVTEKYQVTIESRFGHMVTIDFEELL